jgi:subtilase family protein
MRRVGAGLGGAAMIVLTFQTAMAQGTGSASNEIITEFRRGIIDRSYELAIPVDSVRSVPARTVLQTFGVSLLRPVHPSATPAESVFVNDAGVVMRSPAFWNVYVFTVPAALREACIGQLAALSDVVYAENNVCVEGRIAPPNDPGFGSQWHLANPGNYNRTPGADIKALHAWDFYQGSSATTMGVVDPGIISYNVADFGGRVIRGSGNTQDDHTTGVASVAAATGNNGYRIAGVDWRCKIAVYGGGGIDAMAAGIRLAVNDGIKILNHSWGQVGEGDDKKWKRTLQDAFTYAYQNNVVSSISMPEVGNDSDYPNNYGPGILSVGATDANDRIAPYSIARPFIDVVAPGGMPAHVTEQQIVGLDTDGYEVGYHGTSFAAPQATGLASLLYGYAKQEYGLNLYNDDMEQIIRYSTDDVDDGNPAVYGTGRINAGLALENIARPYRIVQGSNVGGAIVASSGYYSHQFFSNPDPDLKDGWYRVRRHEVHGAVAFPLRMASVLAIWPRGIAGRGYSDANPNRWGYHWSELVPGTVSPTSCVMRTYVYEVWDVTNRFMGWHPTVPENVCYAISGIGLVAAPSVTVQGPVTLRCSVTGSWTAIAANGDGVFAYEWRRRPGGAAEWSEIVGTRSWYEERMGEGALDLQATVISNGQRVSTVQNVAYESGCSGGGGGGGPPECELDPDLCYDGDTQPAGSRPIWSGEEMQLMLNRGTDLKIVLYDVNGRVIANMHKGYLGAGRHVVRGKAGLSQGVYFIRMMGPKWTKSIRTIVLGKG